MISLKPISPIIGGSVPILSALTAIPSALLHYIKKRESVLLYKVTVDMLTTEAILSFLESPDRVGLSDATRNSRVAAIRAFLDCASDRDITLAAR